jgi:hypothetical protein
VKAKIEHAIECLLGMEVVRLAAGLAEHRRSRWPSTTAAQNDLIPVTWLG